MGDKYYLHCIEVDDALGLAEAMKIARKICNKICHQWYHDDIDKCYRFRNIVRSKFNLYTFKKQKYSANVMLLIGKLKEESVQAEAAPAVEGLGVIVKGNGLELETRP